MRPRESASGGDAQYLLHDLDHTTFRFRVKPGANPLPDGLASLVVAALRTQPGATVNELRNLIPPLNECSYGDARALVVQLVDVGILELAGQAALEDVDGRYEWVPACDLCGSPSAGHKVVLWKYNTPVVRCSGCNLLYANPRWKAEHLFGRYTDEYWAQYAEKVQHTALDVAANQARWDPYLDTLEPSRQTGRLLDVGCATGEFLAAAKHRGWTTYGLETSPIAAAHAARITGSSIHVGTLDTAPYPDGWFDAITLWDVIEHVQSPSSYVGRIARLLKNDGMFAITTPNIRSLSYFMLGRRWWVVGPNDHIFYFAPRTLAMLLNKHGFDIHLMHTLGTELANWEQWVRLPALKRLAPALHAITRRVVARFLLGDELYVVARRRMS